MRHDPRRLDRDAYPWAVTLDTRFADMDVNAHLNNVAVARLYEEGRVRFHGQLRTADAMLAAVRFLVARVEIDYLGEGRYPAPVTLGLAVLSFGTTSYRLGLALFQEGACLGLCDAVMVHRGQDRPAPLPPEMRAALGEFVMRP